MRKLASIQVVWNVEPIDGADRIELAHVLGWQCVVNKGEFKPMDFGVYFEIDSFLPIRPEFEFLRAGSYKKTDIMGEGFLLRTKKFRGQISQGLLLPLTAFPELVNEYWKPGDDVSEILGVRKYEIEERATTGGNVIGTLPYDVPHTDETRIQAEPDLLQEFAGLEYYISTKMDGSSHSVSIDENGFHVTGHNYEYKDDDSSAFYRYINSIGLREKMEALISEASDIDTLTIQGEFCAPGIQKNRLKLKKPEWYVFTVRVDGERVTLESMMTICSRLGVATVPIEEIGKDLPSKYPTVEALLERADGEYPNGGKKEGIVVRPTLPDYSNTINDYLSFKVVNNKYLLKNQE